MIAYVNHYTLVTFLFSGERENGLDSKGGGKELSGVERRATVISVYHVRKKSICNKKYIYNTKVALFILLNFDCNVTLSCKDCVIT